MGNIFYSKRVFFIVVLLSCSAFAGKTHEKPFINLDLVELPAFRIASDSTDVSTLGSNYKYLNQSIESCETSEAEYAPKLYLESYDQFPLVPSSPVLKDQLAVFFFKNKKDQMFYASKWGKKKNQSALINFQMSKESKPQYRDVAKRVFDYVNERAQYYGVIGENEKLLQLMDATIPVAEDTCKTHLIHFENEYTLSGVDPSEGQILGFALQKVDYQNQDRLGETIDSDILIFQETMNVLLNLM